jgi:Heavy metal binding domain
MIFHRLLSVPLLAVALLFFAEGLYSVPVVTTQQTTSKKPIRFFYVCPMHPDVQSKQGGKCPKCKMKLEKKQVHSSAAAEQ